MPGLPHIIETTLLVLAAYLLGCGIGYAVHRVLHAARGTRQVTAVVAPVSPGKLAARSRREMTPAARLASAVSPDPVSRPEPVSSPSPSQPRHQIAAKSAGPRPAVLSAPRANGADDLKQIKGIGPRLEAMLNDLGVYHLDQIAAWSAANIVWVDRQLAAKGRISRERWVEQARAITGLTRLSA